MIWKSSRAQEYTLGTLTIDPGIFTTSWIVPTVLLFIFMYHFFSFIFAWISHPAMVPHCNFLTRNINRYFRSSIRLSILSQFNTNFILKEIYCQSYPKIQTWLHYPIILKVTWHKSCINFWHRKIPGKTGSSPRRPLFLHAISFEWTTKS